MMGNIILCLNKDWLKYDNYRIKKKKTENILKKHPNAIIADVTSQAKDGRCSTGNGYY